MRLLSGNLFSYHQRQEKSSQSEADLRLVQRSTFLADVLIADCGLLLILERLFFTVPSDPAKTFAASDIDCANTQISEPWRHV